MKIKTKVIQQKLLEKGWSIKELAQQSGLAYTTVNKAISLNKNYSYKSVGKIAKALSCNPNEIIQS